MAVGGQRHAPGGFTLGKNWYLFYRRLGGPQSRSGQVRKISPLPEFDTRTFQPVASCYTNYAMPAPNSSLFQTELISVGFQREFFIG